MSTPWWRSPVPLLLNCLGWLLDALAALCRRCLCCRNKCRRLLDGKEEEGEGGPASLLVSGGGDSKGTTKTTLLLGTTALAAVPNRPLLLPSPPLPMVDDDEEEGEEEEDGKEEKEEEEKQRGKGHAQPAAADGGENCPATETAIAARDDGTGGISATGHNKTKEADETRSLDRHGLWGLAGRSQRRKSAKAGSAGLGTMERTAAEFDSPGVALLDPSAGHHHSGSAASLVSSAPQRLAHFLSRRLKRTKSFPKLQQQQLKRADYRHQQQQQKQLVAIRASLGPGALRTDEKQQQQQRAQPLSLYLPRAQPPPLSSAPHLDLEQPLCPPGIRSSRSHESLLLMQNGGIPTAVLAREEDQLNQQQDWMQVWDDGSHLLTAFDNGSSRQQDNRSRWMDSLRRRMVRQQQQQQQNARDGRDRMSRVENSLAVWVLEAKGVPQKKRFFCELSLDGRLRARTSAKGLADGICFWGEHFDFQGLPPTQQLCIDLFREAEPGKPKRRSVKAIGSGGAHAEDRHTLLGLVHVPVAELSGRQPTEKWYSVSSSGEGVHHLSSCGTAGDSQLPSLRVRARYQSVHILPLRAYAPLREFLRSQCLSLCTNFEPILGVKAKEDFANSLVRILHTERRAPEALAELVMAEVLGQENDHLLFRGNSLATKAVEAYLKLMASDYLQMALGDFVRQLLCSEVACEVDPLRLASNSSSSASGQSAAAQLERNRQQLTRQVELAWRRILACQDFFPFPLRLLFSTLRRRLDQAGRPELADNLLSSSVFLRFLCPAILSPSLFGLVSEYPTGLSARNLTLIAKSLQTLANFTRFGGKEGYMEFMNAFVEREWRNMQQFLRHISAPLGPALQQMLPQCHSSSAAMDCELQQDIDLGRELSLLYEYVREHWSNQLADQHKPGSPMGYLWNVLLAIRAWGICGNGNGNGNGQQLDDGQAQMEFEEGDEEDMALGGGGGGMGPPSDYENNAQQRESRPNAVGHIGNGGRVGPTAQQQNAVVPENANSGATGLAFCRHSPRAASSSSTAAGHLHSSDDYVLSAALGQLMTKNGTAVGAPGGGKVPLFHLYNQTPGCGREEPHLYDEVAREGLEESNNNNNSNNGGGQQQAVAGGRVLTAQKGTASQETSRRELCTPLVVQRGASRNRKPKTVDDYDTDETEEEEEGEGAIGLAKGQGTPRGSVRHRRAPRKRSTPCLASNISPIGLPTVGGIGPPAALHRQQSSAEFSSSGGGTTTTIASGPAAVHFDSSSASMGGEKRTVGGAGSVPVPPSSGYQSQMNSSSYSSTSNSSSPIDTVGDCPLGLQQPPVLFAHSARSAALPPPSSLCQPGSSSSGSCSTYNSLSPGRQQQQNGQMAAKEMMTLAGAGGTGQTQQSAQWTAAASPRERAQTQQQMGGWQQQQQQMPRPRTNPSCWSIPSSSSSSAGPQQSAAGGRQVVLVGASTADPIAAFVRFPAPPASAPPHKFPTGESQLHWPSSPALGGNGGLSSAAGGGADANQLGPLFQSASVELGESGRQQQRREDSRGRQPTERVHPHSEMELIEAQRRHIAQLTRENAALRRELDSVRALSQGSLPTGEGQQRMETI